MGLVLAGVALGGSDVGQLMQDRLGRFLPFEVRYVPLLLPLARFAFQLRRPRTLCV